MLIFALNVVDAVATLYWVVNGLAREANPLMRELLGIHPLLFVFAKLSLVGLGVWVLWRHRHRPLAVVAIALLFLVYYGLTIYHLRAAVVVLL